MQVTHVQDKVTHAVITGNQAQSFGISDSAEFFHVLSDTLYSNKPKAVVREVLCNAWDAHIQSGKTNIPVIVTIDRDGNFTVKDSGAGIHDDDMYQVYCVYGNSTKKNDGKQTGGFGLGCKAPYAYVDHFGVESCHMGTKSIYNMSKSSGEVAGKPGMTKIVSIPTTDTGLTVKMQIKEGDIRTFTDLVKSIAANGGMKVELNGHPIEPLPFDKCEQGFLLSRRRLTDEVGGTIALLVRYGNVIYPIPLHDELKLVRDQIQKILETSSRSYGQIQHLVFLAQPHTISVTPSRESLSMTDFTVKNLKELMDNFLALFSKHNFQEQQRVVDDCIDFSWENFNPCGLLNTDRSLPYVEHIWRTEATRHVNSDFTVTVTDISRSIVAARYPSDGIFRQMDLTKRLKALENSRFGKRGLIQTFTKALTSKRWYSPKDLEWIHRRVIGPLAVKIREYPQLSLDRLLVYGKNANEETRARRFNYADAVFTEAKKWAPESLEQCMPFLRNIIILTHSRTDVTERVPNFPAMKNWFGSEKNTLVYVVQRSDDKVEAARKAFAEAGMTVIDATKRMSFDPPIVTPVRKKPEGPRKVRGKGIPALSNVLTSAGNVNSTLFKTKPLEDVTLIEKPKFVMKITDRTSSGILDNMGVEETRLLVKAFGSEGGICVSTTQYEKYIAQGALPYRTYIFQKMLDEFTNNKNLRSFMEQSLTKSLLDRDKRITSKQEKLIECLQGDPTLSTHFKISHTADEHCFNVLKLYENIKDQYYYRYDKQMEPIKKVIAAIKSSPEAFKVSEQVTTKVMVEFLDTSNIRDALKPNSSFKPDVVDRVRKLIITIIEG